MLEARSTVDILAGVAVANGAEEVRGDYHGTSTKRWDLSRQTRTEACLNNHCVSSFQSLD